MFIDRLCAWQNMNIAFRIIACFVGAFFVGCCLSLAFAVYVAAGGVLNSLVILSAMILVQSPVSLLLRRWDLLPRTAGNASLGD